MELLLVRHGQTPSNLVHALDTAAPGPGLTDLGHEQARALVHGLRDKPIDEVFISHLVRTRLTAEPLLADRGLEPLVRPGIAEVRAGALEMRTDHEAMETYLQTGFSWAAGDLDVRMPGGEDGHEMLGRFDEVVREAAELGGERVVLVTHGAAARIWTAARATALDLEMAATHALRNTCRITLQGDPDDGWRLLEWDVPPPGVHVGRSAQELDEEDAEEIEEPEEHQEHDERPSA